MKKNSNEKKKKEMGQECKFIHNYYQLAQVQSVYAFIIEFVIVW